MKKFLTKAQQFREQKYARIIERYNYYLTTSPRTVALTQTADACECSPSLVYKVLRDNNLIGASNGRNA